MTYAIVAQADEVYALTNLLQRAVYRLAGIAENAPLDAIQLDAAALEGMDRTLRSAAMVLSTLESASRAGNGEGDWAWMAPTVTDQHEAVRNLVGYAVETADADLA